MLANTNELFVGDADWFGSTTTKVSSGYAYFTTARKLGNNAEAALPVHIDHRPADPTILHPSPHRGPPKLQ